MSENQEYSSISTDQIGQLFRVRRKELGLTLIELARTCGVSKSSISSIENNKQSPSVDVLVRLCPALGLTINIDLVLNK